MPIGKDCNLCAKRTSWIGIVVGTFLALFKIITGFLGRSKALIASGMCNITDVGSSVAVLIGVKFAQKGRNRSYQYGFGKIEFIVSVSLSIFMIFGNVLLIIFSIIDISKQVIVVPHMVVFFVAILSSAINALIYKFADCGAKQLNSPSLAASAEHNKIDAASGILVAIGVLATRAGLHWIDPLIAIIEGLHLLHGSSIIFWDGIRNLLDAGKPKSYRESIKRQVLSVKNIQKVNMVRARQSGSKIFLDIEIAIDPELSMLASKKIIQSIKARLRKKNKHIGNIFVMVTPGQAQEALEEQPDKILTPV